METAAEGSRGELGDLGGAWGVPMEGEKAALVAVAVAASMAVWEARGGRGG